MTSPGRGAATVLTLALLGCSPQPPSANPPATSTSTPPELTAPAATGSASTPGPRPTNQPPAGGLFSVPAPVAASSTTSPPGPGGRADPIAVARAYAAGLYTVDWTRPLPTAQKVAATTAWATPSATAKLAHGQHHQPPPTDPRVAAGQVDTVTTVAVEDADPVPGGHAYLATIDISTRTTTGVTTTQAYLVLTVVRHGDGWLVDHAQVLG